MWYIVFLSVCWRNSPFSLWNCGTRQQEQTLIVSLQIYMYFSYEGLDVFFFIIIVVYLDGLSFADSLD